MILSFKNKNIYKEKNHTVVRFFGIKIKFKSEKKYILRKIVCWLLNNFFQVDKNKILITNPLTWQYADNSKYISQELSLRNIKQYKLIWLVNNNTDCSAIPACFKQVHYNSIRGLYELATAKIWVTNSHMYLPLKCGLKKKEETFYVQTWHGSMGIKKCDADASHVYKNLNELKWQIQSSSQFDFIPVDSDFEKNAYITQHRGFGKIEKIGKARDSIFYKDYKPYIKKVKDFYKIPYDTKIVLYAPTWRPDGRMHCFNIDTILLKKTLTEKFGGKWQILIRMHSRMKNYVQKMFDNREIIDASKYPDMQELLVAADVLISDYSSCIPEYVILKKPSFIYAADLWEYNNNNGFYYPLSTLPSPVAEDNGELANNILNFDNDLFLKKADEFLIKMGHKDDANSCQRIVDLILEKMKNDR